MCAWTGWNGNWERTSGVSQPQICVEVDNDFYYIVPTKETEVENVKI